MSLFLKPTFAQQKLHYQWKPYSNAAKVSICQQWHACQFAIRQWVDSGAFCLRMFTRMQKRMCSNHIIISSYHHIMHAMSFSAIRLNCSVSLWRWLLEAMEENFSKNKQSSLNALMVLKSIVTTFAWNSKKPACHRAPIFWLPLLWINLVDSSLFTPGRSCFSLFWLSPLLWFDTRIPFEALSLALSLQERKVTTFRETLVWFSWIFNIFQSFGQIFHLTQALEAFQIRDLRCLCQTTDVGWYCWWKNSG